MIMTSPVSCVSDACYFYRIVCFFALMYFLSSDDSDSLSDESDELGSDY